MHWIEKLKSRWSLKTTWQVILVLIIFSLTGSTILFLKRPVLAFFTVHGQRHWIFTVMAYFIIIPLYNILILFYGFIFGQFNFFWNYQKRMYGRLLRKKKNDLPQE